MKSDTFIAKTINAIGEKPPLDAVCKKLLANKAILAHILKACVEEFYHCSVDDIEQRYITGNPRISQTIVNQDEKLVVGDERIDGKSNVDSSVSEGTVTYDIRFDVINPLVANKLLTMIINVECQNNFYPGYPLVKRGIYYGSRMISSQYGTVFTKSHYEKIKKVYSIWICLNPPKYRQFTINLKNSHSGKKTHFVGRIWYPNGI